MHCASNQLWEDIALGSQPTFDKAGDYENSELGCIGVALDHKQSIEPCQDVPGPNHESGCDSSLSSDEDEEYGTPPATPDPHFSDDSFNSQQTLPEGQEHEGETRKNSLIGKLLAEIHHKLRQAEQRRSSCASSLSTSDFNRKPNIRRHSLFAKGGSRSQSETLEDANE